MKTQHSKSSFHDGVDKEPINRASAMMFARGVKPDHGKIDYRIHWEICPQIHSPQMVAKLYHIKSQDLTGRRQGRLKVVGLSKDMAGRWVTRCDCGDYEARSSKAITNPRNTNDSCSKCRKLDQAKRSHYYHMTGKELPP